MDKEFLNHEGYPDPTAYKALRNVKNSDEERAMFLFKVLNYIIRNADFELVERIHIRDKRSGKEWK